MIRSSRLLCLGITSLLMLFASVAYADLDPKSQMRLGNPDKATTSPSNRQHYLVQRGQYALSYNDKLRFPNWVAWHLSAKDIGDTERGKFVPDPEFPNDFAHVVTGDYNRSGYDRGHNCPSKDRSASREDNDIVFYMSNITPQAHGMNAGPWEQLEAFSRTLAQKGNELYIVCGHGFSNPRYKTIGRNGIAVPDFGWKVIVVVPRGKQPEASSRVIAVRMPNNNTISKRAWKEFLTTPAELEKATGLTLFDALPDTVASALRAKKDTGDGAGGGRQVPTRSRSPLRPRPRAQNAPAGLVWVNTKSGIYSKAGTRYYGKTQQGKYMTEAEALKAGYHAAGGH